MRISYFAIAAILAPLTACGGGSTKPSVTDPTPAAATPEVPKTRDLVFNKYPEVPLQGMVFKPQALGRPSLGIRVSPKRKTSLKKARKKVAKSKKLKENDVLILATMLWDAARKQKDAAKSKALREEARAALSKLHDAAAGKSTINNLIMLSGATLYLGDEAAAAKLYEDMVARFADNAFVKIDARTWLTYLYLKAGRNAEAAKVVDGWTSASEGMTHLSRYVLAWVQFRKGDNKAAAATLADAANVWKGGYKNALQEELTLFLARAGTPLAEADKLLGDLVGGDKVLRFKALYRLHDHYRHAGYLDLAIETLRMVATKVLDQVPEKTLVAFNFKLAEYEFGANRPGKAATAVTAAFDGLSRCDKCTDSEKENVAKGIASLGTTFHNVYAHTLDDNYYAPALALYDLYLKIPGRPDADRFKSHKHNLEQTKAQAQVEQGKHDGKVMWKMLRMRHQAAVACYERVLQGKSDLAGPVKLTIMVESDGKVVGAATEPAKGLEGMSAVAGCIEERAKGWSFAGRSQKGKTSLVVSYSFSPKAPAPKAKPASEETSTGGAAAK